VVSPVLAATTQQSVALAIFAIVLVGWVLWIISTTRRGRPEVGAELEVAPNRREPASDEEMEGARMERTMMFSLGCLVIIAIGLPLYWLAEPGRQEGAITYFDERNAGETFHHGQPVGGGALFALTAEGGFNCAGCHGGLDGGTAPYTITDPETGQPLRQVQWSAPSLRYAALRYTDEQLTDIISCGRPFSPMPAWGVECGGPMNAQQISNLVAYLKFVSGVPPYSGADDNIAQAQKDAQVAAEAELARMNGLQASLAAAQAERPTVSEDERDALEEEIRSLELEIANNQEKTLGAALFNLNCARCHTLGWSYGGPALPGTGAMGPSMANEKQQFPNETDQIDFVTNGAQRGQPYGEQGQSSGKMPFFGQVLTDEQIKLIVDYERRLADQYSPAGG
jgi:mono/diheme cytochrome c family protein